MTDSCFESKVLILTNFGKLWYASQGHLITWTPIKSAIALGIVFADTAFRFAIFATGTTIIGCGNAPRTGAFCWTGI